MANAYLSEQTWQQLDAYAGALSPQTSRRLRVVASLLVLLTVSAVLVWRSGVVVPRLSADLQRSSADSLTKVVTVDIRVDDDEWRSVRVTAAGRSGPGLRLLSTTGLPLRLGAHGSAVVSLRYQVTSCKVVIAGAWPIPIRVERIWGAQTVSAGLEPFVLPGALSAAGSDPQPVPWQRALADEACNVG